MEEIYENLMDENTSFLFVIEDFDFSNIDS